MALVGSNGSNSGSTYASPFVDYAFGGAVVASYGAPIQIGKAALATTRRSAATTPPPRRPTLLGSAARREAPFTVRLGMRPPSPTPPSTSIRPLAVTATAAAAPWSWSAKGLGGAIVSGYGSNVVGPNTLTVSKSTFTHNDAIGGDNNRGTVSLSAITDGDLKVVLRDDSQSPKLLSGVASLFNQKVAPGFDAFNPDAKGASAGLNFEHIISGHKNANNSFTPRGEPMRSRHCRARK